MIDRKYNSSSHTEPLKRSLPIQNSKLYPSQQCPSLYLYEFKILDLYISRIDARHPEQRWVRFEKGEIERLLGFPQIGIDDLKNRLENLYVTVDLPRSKTPRALDTISLFEQATCTLDEESRWQIDLECTSAAMKYIFNSTNIDYIRYKIRSICHLTSKYSYILFLYLEENRSRVIWEEDVSILRKILGCEIEFFDSFPRFNQKILRQCRKELLEKTECSFSYVPVHQDKLIGTVRFKVDPILIVKSDYNHHIECQSSSTNFITLLENACCDSVTGLPEFSRNEMIQIGEILRTLPLHKLPTRTPYNDYRSALYNYLSDRYAALNHYSSDNTGDSRIDRLINMIKSDAGIKI